ncbi:MAG: HSP90 family protein [Actinobacteria bacterium]|nr:HSP90 family protein [Actinomycetota bacterium]
MVDLLSQHLYSSPRVYLRELLQNAVDAVTARLALDRSAPAVITVQGGDQLVVTDTGVGLTEPEVHEFLATIGRSSKRDDAGLASAREGYIGQFGIGLLACFMIADEIRVVTRSASQPDAPAVEWRGFSDGSYTLQTLANGSAVQPGMTVTLTPRPGSEEWTSLPKVIELARHYGSLLRYSVTVLGPGTGPVTISETPPVWRRSFGSPVARREALVEYGHRTFGFAPLDVIDLELPLVGLSGVGYVLPITVHPARHAGHRVHVKGMLVSDTAPELLPEWAFFVRCVVDAEGLRPTASREALYEDETLAGVRDALGGQLRDWLTGLAASQPGLLSQFLSAHHLAVKALARHDDQLLQMLLPWLPFETTDGNTTLEEFSRVHPTVLVTRTVEEFRQVAPIAAAAGLGVVNGGYTYDRELVHRLPEVRPGTTVADLDPETVTAHLDAVSPEVELAAARFLTTARQVLDRLGCDAVLRSFHPVTVPALLVDSREARHERVRAEAEAQADGVWADILGALRSGTPRAQLVFNHECPLVRKVAAIVDPALTTTAVEALYGQALLLSRRPLRATEHALLNRAFMSLLEHAAHDPGAGAEDT